MAENQSLASDSDDENTRNRRSRLRSGNNDKRSICWRYFEPFKVPRDGTTIKCAIDGCNTSYVWRGSTSNLLGHLKTNHSITKSSEHTTYIRSSSNINSVNSELEINLSLIKFIVSAGAPFSIIEYLKSAEFVNPQYKLPPSNIVEEQINRAYDRLFFQLKLKAQQTKSVTLSFHLIPGGSIHHIKMFMGVTCHFLSENFESYRFLLCISRVTKLCGDENCGRIWRNECFEALNKWGLINQKFISIGSSTIGILKGLSEKLCQNYIQNFIPLIYEEKDEVQYDINKLIQMCLQGWTEKNNGSQGMLKYNKDDICFNSVTEEQALELANNVMINSDNIMKEISQFIDLEHEVLKSFLNSIPLNFQKTGILTKELILFLDPRIKSNHFSYAIKRYVQAECQIYYSKMLNRADAQAEAAVLIQNAQVVQSIADITQSEVQNIATTLAYEEVENYIDYPDLLLNENTNIFKWWQDSKDSFPGLAAIAREYLSIPLEELEDIDQLKNIEILENTYQDFDTSNKISFLQNNMKYFDLITNDL
ncbi:zinc finger bed domain-containing protein 4-like [Gigaspora margarita]|uniref:Zinc finger bed domain-containing protein 4-like n=1 Tax=Gigaspora margarita TaxID=4874 RepID=A0A8H4APF9_GIGMA|nr:zinc finger bed domain-containing protein 4-like [Gigaspora margarita]